MASHKPPEIQEATGFDLTPMIDITFQLIIFIMLVTDMSSAELERVELPMALKAVEEEYTDPQRVIINVMKDGKFYISHKEYTFDQLRGEMQVRAKLKPDPTTKNASALEVMVRCDGRADYKYVQQAMQICGQVGVYKLECAAMIGEPK